MAVLINVSLDNQDFGSGLKPRIEFPDAMVQAMIGVIGASKANDELCALAEKVGEEIALRDSIVLSGGLTGVMEAVCRGARKRGGVTVGIIPSDCKDDANEHVQIPIVTGLGVARNVVIVKTADVLIAIGGQFGTLSEMAHALNMGKTVIALRSWEIDKLSRGELSGLVKVDDPVDAVAAAFDAIKAKV